MTRLHARLGEMALARGVSRGWWRDLLGPVAVALLLCLPLVTMPIARDQANWLTAAMGMMNGKVFYRDFLAFNPPGVAYAYSLALTLVGDPQYALILVHTVTVALMVIFVYLLLCDSVSRLAALMSAWTVALWWPTSHGWWEIAQKDFLPIPWVLAATWLVFRQQSRPFAWLVFAAGVCTGVAALFKPTFAPAGLLIGCALIVRSGITRRAGMEVLALGLGVLVSLLPTLIYLGLNGALGDAWFSTFELAPAYGSVRRAPFVRTLIVSVVLSIDLVGPWLVIPAFLGVVAFFSKRRHLWLLIPVVTFIGSAVVQGRGWPYQLLGSVLVLLCACTMGVAWYYRVQPGESSKTRFIVADLLTLVVAGSVLAKIVGPGTFFIPQDFIDIPYSLHVAAFSGLVDRESY
ncbi:MAG: hypothetical protein HN348_15830, partial [Proteobacteria bacterium]|nr:hypothetical protein [Pseudomonadota bacterium]